MGELTYLHCCRKGPQAGSLNSRRLFLTIQETGKSKVRGQLFSSGDASYAFAGLHGSMKEERSERVLWGFSLKGSWSCQIGPLSFTHVILFLPNLP